MTNANHGRDLARSLRDAKVGLQLYELVVNRPTWVHRRVETIELMDDQSVRRSVSIDLHLPKDSVVSLADRPPAHVIPLALLRKRVLHCFDLRDHSGNRLPILTTRENAGMSGAFLWNWAEVVLDREILPDESLVDDILQLVRSDSRIASKSLDPFMDAVTEDHRTLYANNNYRYYLQALARNFMLISIFAGSPNDVGITRRVVKYSYEEYFDVHRRGRASAETGYELVEDSTGPQSLSEETAILLRVFGQYLGLAPYHVVLSLAEIGQTQSYHVEVRAPVGLEIGKGGLIVQRSPDTLEVQEVEGPKKLIHLRVGDLPQESVGTVATKLQIQRRGWLRIVLMAAVATSVFLFLFPYGFDELQKKSGAPEAASLLVALNGLALSILARPDEHAMASFLRQGVRVALMVSAAATFAAATGLLLVEGGTLVEWWLLGRWVTVGVAVLIGASYLTSRPPGGWMPARIRRFYRRIRGGGDG